MSYTITDTLARFSTNTDFRQLPDEVVDYTKLVILDSLICGIAAGGLQRSQMMHNILSGIGGQEEATVFGLERRVPAVNAGMANAEIMNLLDADDTFFTSSHFAVFNVAAALAEAQRSDASGKAMLLSTAIGFDINARLNLALQLMSESEDGSFQWSPVQGMGFAAVGTATSSGIIRGISAEKMHNAFGLVSWMAPTPVVNSMPQRSSHVSFKYANYAGAAQAGMMAVMMAEQGYIGEANCLDGERFTRAQGCLATDHELLLDELGAKWWILETALKYYPSCRYTHPPIDMLKRLMSEQHISADKIEKIEVRMNPMAYALKIFREPPQQIATDHLAPLNGAFNIPYALAMAALDRKPGPSWFSESNLTDPQVWELAGKIVTAEDVSARNEVARAFRESRIRRFRKTPASMTVWANGKEYLCEADYADGDPWTEETRATWDSITEKFFNFCGDMLPEKKILGLIEQIRHLEQIGHIGTELKL